MKSLAELKEIREKMQGQVGLRSEDHNKIRVVVGMATCGIASGARPVLNTLADMIQSENLGDKIVVTQTGCIGLCQYEPIVEVIAPFKQKVTYINMTTEKAVEVVTRHLIGGHVVDAYTLSASELK
ncbi:MAG: (2Fe-2S) ferredoxin domain-containing protein [Faecalibacterium sp.]